MKSLFLIIFFFVKGLYPPPYVLGVGGVQGITNQIALAGAELSGSRASGKAFSLPDSPPPSTSGKVRGVATASRPRDSGEHPRPTFPNPSGRAGYGTARNHHLGETHDRKSRPLYPSNSDGYTAGNQTTRWKRTVVKLSEHAARV